ncbi:hypothetical protein J6590_087478 [Homalodisca vitripennis]|nr:hypothetical protein J6590_087478 [Homalodisca vitripennis]
MTIDTVGTLGRAGNSDLKHWSVNVDKTAQKQRGNTSLNENVTGTSIDTRVVMYVIFISPHRSRGNTMVYSPSVEEA